MHGPSTTRWAPAWAACLCVLWLAEAEPARAGEWSLRLRAQAAEEYDSNAKRLQQFGTAQVAGDFLTRLLLGGELGYAGPALSLQADYACGAKLFYRETSEHMVANQLDLTLLHRPSPGRRVGLRLGLADSTQAEHVRDYLQVHADALLRLFPSSRLALEISAGGRAFRFKPNPGLFDHAGPVLGLSLQIPLGAGFGLSLGYHFGVRFFHTAALKIDPDSATLDTLPTDRSRQDERHDTGLRLRFQAEWLDELRLHAQLGYAFTATLSNSAGFAADWHRLEAVVALQLPWELTLHLMGRVQLTSYPDGLYLGATATEPDADENENAFVARLTWRFWQELQLVAQVSVYRNTFAAGGTEPPTFARETYQLGLAWDWSPL